MSHFPRPWILAAALALSPVSAAQLTGPMNGASQSSGQHGGPVGRASPPQIITGGTWTLANSPYVLSEDIQVVHLTIEAGVEVVAQPGVEILVRGELTAEGTVGVPIRFFNASAQGKWDGLRFQNASGSSSLDFCQIEGSQSSGIEIVNSTVFLRNCELFDNETASSGGGIAASIDNGDLILENCLLFANTALAGGGGIDAWIPNGSLVLDGCRIQANQVNPDQTASITRGGGVLCRDSLGLLITGSTIKDNLLSANSGFGARAEGGGVWVGNTPLTLALSVIESNVVDSWCDGGYCDASAFGGGLYAKDSSSSLTLTVIRENRLHGWVVPFSGFNKESCSASGAGVYVQNDSQEFRATNCVISGNEAKSTGKWRGAYGAGVRFHGNKLGSDLNLTNCVVSRNRAVDGGWYASGGGALQPGIVVSYGAFGMYQGGEGVIQNTIATQNTGCNLNYYNPTAPCTPFALPGLEHLPAVTQRVNYSIIGNTVLAGVGNLNVEPQFVGGGTAVHDFGLSSGSSAIDSGNPAPAFGDVSFPPSQGGSRNDMGINGGPLAGGWGALPNGS
jgi:hypothetical protein